MRQVTVDARDRDSRAEVFKVVTTLLDVSIDGRQIGGLYERRWSGEVCQADCTSRFSLYLSGGSPHSGRDGVAGAGPVGAPTPAQHAGAIAMHRDHDRSVPRLQPARDAGAV
jgi:hypothetical protein